jgi:hypothetical protein
MAKRTCSEDGCDRPVKGRGLCDPHYKRRWRSGAPMPPTKGRSICEVVEDGIRCMGTVEGRGLCQKHWERQRRNGDPLVRQRGMPPAQRFWPKADKNGPVPIHRPELGPCWLWTGTIDKRTGYGTFSVHPATVLAHRFSYQLSVGPIPGGRHLDHLCHPGDGSCPRASCPHRRCVNPAHLKPSTPAENNRRSTSPTALNGRKKRCKRGHEFTAENTYVYKLRNGRYGRSCRECSRLRRRAYSKARRSPGQHPALF